ncbi:MAG: hypothetical protein RR326_16235, partial [Stenotrophomonas sp.]
MSGLLGGLIEGVVDFVTDIWVLRRQRSGRNRTTNSLGRDAADTALFDVWALLLSLLAFACFAVMFFVAELLLWISLLPVAAAVAYLVHRW